MNREELIEEAAKAQTQPKPNDDLVLLSDNFPHGHPEIAPTDDEREALANLIPLDLIHDRGREGFPEDAFEAADRILAAGFRRSEVPEWEYGNEQLMHSHVAVFPASSEAVAKAQAWLYPVRRRRKAGPWVPVKQESS